MRQEAKWTDRSVPKHKHNFNVEAYAVLEKDNITFHYRVMKCDKCSSFINATYTERPIDSLPIVNLYSPHKSIGFKDSKLIHRNIETR